MLARPRIVSEALGSDEETRLRNIQLKSYGIGSHTFSRYIIFTLFTLFTLFTFKPSSAHRFIDHRNIATQCYIVNTYSRNVTHRLIMTVNFSLFEEIVILSVLLPILYVQPASCTQMCSFIFCEPRICVS